MIDFTTSQPLEDAVDSLSARTPVGSAMRSAEWAGVPVEVRQRAFFMATVENERILAIAKAKISQRLKLERSKLADGGEGVTMDRSRFIAEMQDELEAVGYRPDPVLKGGLRDISSHKRLALVWDMQLAMAEGYAQHKAATTDPDVMDAFPAWELVRGADRENERDWPEIWAQAGGNFYGEPGEDYPQAPGRMIALVTDPIWTAISQFGTPWPPFRWGSGMILRRLRRRVAEELQVIGPDDVMQPPAAKDFNEGLKASLAAMPESSVENLRSELGDAARIDADAIALAPRAAADIPADLAARSQAIAEVVPVADVRVQAGVAAAGTGRVRLFQVTLGDAAEVLASALRKVLPRNLRIEARGGKLFVWRGDLLDADPDALASGDNSALRGFGSGKGAMVEIIGPAGAVLLAFETAADAAIAYARMRAKDFSLALGQGFGVRINGKEVKL